MINYRRERIKSGIIIAFILGFAAISTYCIYNNFKDKRQIDYNTDTLDVTFHEKSGDKVTLKKVTPVTDSVGLSSKAYTFTIKNNLSTPVKYKVQIIEDKEMMKEDDCGEYQIPHSIIKVAIHKNGKGNKLYMLNEIEKGNIVSETIKPNEEVQYTMRFWTTDNTLTMGSILHYHGKIKVLQTNNEVATAIN